MCLYLIFTQVCIKKTLKKFTAHFLFPHIFLTLIPKGEAYVPYKNGYVNGMWLYPSHNHSEEQCGSTSEGMPQLLCRLERPFLRLAIRELLALVGKLRPQVEPMGSILARELGSHFVAARLETVCGLTLPVLGFNCVTCCFALAVLLMQWKSCSSLFSSLPF